MREAGRLASDRAGPSIAYEAGTPSRSARLRTVGHVLHDTQVETEARHPACGTRAEVRHHDPPGWRRPTCTSAPARLGRSRRRRSADRRTDPPLAAAPCRGRDEARPSPRRSAKATRKSKPLPEKAWEWLTPRRRWPPCRLCTIRSRHRRGRPAPAPSRNQIGTRLSWSSSPSRNPVAGAPDSRRHPVEMRGAGSSSRVLET